jgi:hypothetical protein
MDMTGMMPGPEGSATPMDPMMMGDGDVLGDGVLGPNDPQNPSPEGEEELSMEMQGEMEIRQALLKDAYGTQLPSRRIISKDNS